MGEYLGEALLTYIVQKKVQFAVLKIFQELIFYMKVGFLHTCFVFSSVQVGFSDRKRLSLAYREGK